MTEISTSATGGVSTATGLPVSCVSSMTIEGKGDLLQPFKAKDEMQKWIKISVVTAQTKVEEQYFCCILTAKNCLQFASTNANKNFKGQWLLFFCCFSFSLARMYYSKLVYIIQPCIIFFSCHDNLVFVCFFKGGKKIPTLALMIFTVVNLKVAYSRGVWHFLFPPVSH